MRCDRMQLQRAVGLAAVQEHSHPHDRDMGDCKREQNDLPPRPVKQAGVQETEDTKNQWVIDQEAAP